MKKFVIIGSVLLALILTAILCCHVKKASVPTVKEGRFDFSVTYEAGGEVQTYSGVYVCKYDGVLITLVSTSVEWKEYIENEKEMDLPIYTNEVGTVYLNFGFSPEYFMDDPVWDDLQPPQPTLYMACGDSDSDSYYILGDEEEIAIYGVKILSYEYARPIENSYKKKWTFGRFVPSIN